ncbi:MAG: cytochrome b/b6 domain-containing protein [Paracoccus sp. (in: a-proteobacteria)]|nr:cytochrome b/b6 domain-containing protein [Paracoccus sp. (in: a-proteobacteria)]
MNRTATTGGRDSVRIVRVWAPLVRLIHWSLALCILLKGALTDPEGKPHEMIGYVALALVGIRLMWGLIGPAPARLWAVPPSPGRAIRHLRAVIAGDKTVHLTHNPLGALMDWNIWTTVAVIGATGIMMGPRAYFGVGWAEEAHEMLFNWLLVSVALHVAGVAVDSIRSRVNLVHSMVTGGIVLLMIELRELLRRTEAMDRGIRAARGEMDTLIDSFFTRWGLTPSERDAALLILKGFDNDAITGLRGTAPAPSAHRPPASMPRPVSKAGRNCSACSWKNCLPRPTRAKAAPPAFPATAPAAPAGHW